MCSTLRKLNEKHTPLRLEELVGLSPQQLRRKLLERMASSVEGRERFWRKVNILNRNDCWPWKGCINRKYGYYTIRVYSPKGKGKNYNFEVHRVSYFLEYGELPEDMLVCHKCDNRSCANPNHLFLGTYQDNSSDMVSKNRQVIGEKIKGAKLTAQKVYEIRRLRKEGVTQREVARMFGINHQNVWFITSKQTWKHLPDDPMQDPMFN